MKQETKEKIKMLLKREIIASLAFFSNIEKKIIFESYGGKQYSDNPRAISEKMHTLFPGFKQLWVLVKDWEGDIPDYVEVCRKGTFAYWYALATCFAFVRNEAMLNDFYKRKGQLYIQTWHGDRGIKKILYDSLKARGIEIKDNIYCDSELTDLFVIGSDYAAERIKSAFRYHGAVIKTGCPRNDCLIFPHKFDEVLQSLGVDKRKKILLYAPTLRRNRRVVQTTLDIDETLQHLSARGGEWVCLVRAHPKSLGVDVGNFNHIIDVSKYPDMADLLMVADFLITDYSSCAGDFLLRKKPLILAQFDLEQYMEEDRTFHVDINKTGYLIARTQDELNHFIDTMSDEQFAENCEKVLAYFGTHETGRASEDVCRWIEQHYEAMYKE